VQAAIAALHARAARASATDWKQIAALYKVLELLAPSPLVLLNRAVAVAMAEDPEAGLALLEGADLGAIEDYHLLHATRAELLRRAGRTDASLAAYRRAIHLAANDAERRWLERRLGELEPPSG
jgi:RNA polymerase sigma-70 factor (ECF subfamily)